MNETFDAAAVITAHDRQVRRSLTVPPGYLAEDTGRVVRVLAPPGSDSSFVEWSSLSEADVDAEIAAQLTFFAGRSFEWKTYGRDTPADLPQRLLAAGFVAEDPEAFVVGELASVLAATEGHDAVDGVQIRPAVAADLPAMVAMNAAVWGHDSSRMLAELFDERASSPAETEILVAVAGGEIVSDGWVRLPRGVDFASLWGGATLPAWRGRGIYRALVRRRALLARESGHRWLQVDCTPDSRPILERLGMVTVDTTTPYRWIG